MQQYHGAAELSSQQMGDSRRVEGASVLLHHDVSETGQRWPRRLCGPLRETTPPALRPASPGLGFQVPGSV